MCSVDPFMQCKINQFTHDSGRVANEFIMCWSCAQEIKQQQQEQHAREKIKVIA